MRASIMSTIGGLLCHPESNFKYTSDFSASPAHREGCLKVVQVPRPTTQSIMSTDSGPKTCFLVWVQKMLNSRTGQGPQDDKQMEHHQHQEHCRGPFPSPSLLYSCHSPLPFRPFLHLLENTVSCHLWLLSLLLSYRCLLRMTETAY